MISTNCFRRIAVLVTVLVIGACSPSSPTATVAPPAKSPVATDVPKLSSPTANIPSIPTRVTTPTFALSSTSTMTSSPLARESLPSGQYIVYSISTAKGGSLYLLSENGTPQGMIAASEDANAYLSPDGNFIAYSALDHVSIFDLKHNTTMDLPDRYNCFQGFIGLAWSPDGANLAITCGGSIYVLGSQDGVRVNTIPSPVKLEAPRTVRADRPIWSPDGKWLAYYIQRDDPQDTVDGPFVTDTSCFVEKQTCEQKTHLLANEKNPHIMAWTPENLLSIAAVTSTGYSIRTYNAKTNQLVRTFDLSDLDCDIKSMAWSPNGQSIAVGCYNGIFLIPIATGKPILLSDQGTEVNSWLTVP
jgi:WD40 repeat protein